MKDKVVEIIKFGLQHSTAQAFLIFSGFLVVVSMLWAKEYINIVFFTLFYALIVHYLTALRRHESLGRYAVGSDHKQGIRFTVIYISYFIWWVIGVGIILLSTSNSVIKLFEFFLPRLYMSDILLFILLFIGIGIFFAPFIMTIVWLRRTFANKWKVEKYLCGNYKAKYICKNCGGEEKEVEIPKKRPYWDHPCPDCGLYELEKKEKRKTPQMGNYCIIQN